MWVMKEYGVKNSWVMLISIGPPLVKPYVTMRPLAYLNNGGEVLLNYDDKKLIWYDLKRRSVRRVPFRGLPRPFYVELYVCSLVPLDVSGKTNRMKKEVQEEKAKDKKRDGFLSTGFKLVL